MRVWVGAWVRGGLDGCVNGWMWDQMDGWDEKLAMGGFSYCRGFRGLVRSLLLPVDVFNGNVWERYKIALFVSPIYYQCAIHYDSGVIARHTAGKVVG